MSKDIDMSHHRLPGRMLCTHGNYPLECFQCLRAEVARLTTDLSTAQGLLARVMGPDVDILSSMNALLTHREAEVARLTARLQDVAARQREDTTERIRKWLGEHGHGGLVRESVRQVGRATPLVTEGEE